MHTCNQFTKKESFYSMTMLSAYFKDIQSISLDFKYQNSEKMVLQHGITISFRSHGDSTPI